MAKRKLKMRAKVKDGVITAKVLLTHPMETGARKDKESGKLIPAHYIQEVIVDADGENVLIANWNGSVSKNPYLSLKYKGELGSKLTVSWKDNQGETGSGKINAK